MTSPHREAGLIQDDQGYQDAIAKRAVDISMGRWLAEIHWNFYMILTFHWPVGEEYARRAGVDFITSFGPTAYGLVAWGEGLVGGRVHIHSLIGGLPINRPTRGGFDFRAQQEAIAQLHWTHGFIAKLEPYDSRKRATHYLPTHHELEIVGNLNKHRTR